MYLRPLIEAERAKSQADGMAQVMARVFAARD